MMQLSLMTEMGLILADSRKGMEFGLQNKERWSKKDAEKRITFLFEKIIILHCVHSMDLRLTIAELSLYL